jgi:hypothetical protein
MPFTLSHPAIILPFFKNKKWSITGLVIGSMSPDFEFFFRMRTQSEISHTFLGLLLIDLPLAIIVVVVFHGIIKHTLIANSPDFVQNRLVELKNSNWFDYFKKNSGIVLASFFLGAASHFFLDSLTHWDGYIVQRVSFLNDIIFSIPLYEWAQYISSIIGLIAIFLYFYRLPKDVNTGNTVSVVFWITTLFFALIIILLRFTIVEGWNRIADIIIGVISSVVIAITFTSLVFIKLKKAT